MTTGIIISQLLSAAAGAGGFSLLFGIRRLDRFLISTIVGAAVWGIYLMITATGLSDLVGCCCAAFAGTVIAEVLARLCKAPATVFIAPSVIPLIPGGSLFYSMQFFVQGDRIAGGERLLHTAAIAGVIAIGIYAASAIFRFLSGYFRKSC